MTNLNPERKIVHAVWNRKGLFLIHLICNALIAFLAYQWLWIPDRTIFYLAVSLVSGLAIVVLVLWLHGSTLASFRAMPLHGAQTSASAFRPSLSGIRRLFAFAAWAAVTVLIVGLVLHLGKYEEDVSIKVASFLTFRLRKPIAPSSVAQIYSWLLTVFGLLVVPAALLPLGSRVAEVGFRGFGRSKAIAARSPLWRVRYWIACILLFTIGAVIPYELVWWIPKFNGVFLESTSAVVRFLAAYLLAVTSWLLLASIVGFWSSDENSY